MQVLQYFSQTTFQHGRWSPPADVQGSHRPAPDDVRIEIHFLLTAAAYLAAASEL